MSPPTSKILPVSGGFQFLSQAAKKSSVADIAARRHRSVPPAEKRFSGGSPSFSGSNRLPSSRRRHRLLPWPGKTLSKNAINGGSIHFRKTKDANQTWLEVSFEA